MMWVCFARLQAFPVYNELMTIYKPQGGGGGDGGNTV